MKLFQLLFIIFKITTQEYNPPESLFLYQLQCSVYLILHKPYMMKHQRILFLFAFRFHILDHFIEKGIIDTFYENCNRLSILALQVPCTVIRDIVILLDHTQDLIPGLRINIWVVI